MKKSQNSTKEVEIKSRVHIYHSNLIDNGWVMILQRLYLEIPTSVCNKIYTIGNIFRCRIWWCRFKVLKYDTFVSKIKILVRCIFNGPVWQLNFTSWYLDIWVTDLGNFYIVGNLRQWRENHRWFTWLKSWISLLEN